jgi:hypothetical protein
MSTPWSRSFPNAGPPPSGTPAWYVREAPLTKNRWRARCVVSEHFPDGTLVDGPIESSGAHEHWRADIDDAGRSVLQLNEAAVEGAPPLWFVAVPEPNESRAAMVLAGFATDHVATGTVLTNAEFFTLPVKSEEQIGAIRWWHLEGVVDQLFVAEQWRRRHLATALIYAANALQVHNGWPSRLHSDGRRTELGQHLSAGMLFPDRFAALETTSPPMDPPKRNGVIPPI